MKTTVKVPAKPAAKTTTGGSLLITMVVVVAILAAMAGGNGKGGGGSHPPHYLSGDPCPEGTPGWRLAAPEWLLTDSGSRFRLHLTCEEFRFIANDNYWSQPESKDIIDCISAVLDKGGYRSGGGIRIFTLSFAGPGSLARVVASQAEGHIISVVVDGGSWADCAGA